LAKALSCPLSDLFPTSSQRTVKGK
jgi:hypothetical protein